MDAVLSGVVLGLHLFSVHAPAHDSQNDVNYGLYVRAPEGIVFGAYHNTIDRTSVYAGKEFDWGRWSVEFVAMYGYQKITRSCPDYSGCYHYTGFTPGAILPAVAVSYALPLTFSGVHPRVTFMPGFKGASNVFHLSIEKEL